MRTHSCAGGALDEGDEGTGTNSDPAPDLGSTSNTVRLYHAHPQVYRGALDEGAAINADPSSDLGSSSHRHAGTHCSMRVTSGVPSLQQLYEVYPPCSSCMRYAADGRHPLQHACDIEYAFPAAAVCGAQLGGWGGAAEQRVFACSREASMMVGSLYGGSGFMTEAMLQVSEDLQPRSMCQRTLSHAPSVRGT
eukprot:1158899-Pelagomonas_calceolata.AAC.5